LINSGYINEVLVIKKITIRNQIKLSKKEKEGWRRLEENKRDR